MKQITCNGACSTEVGANALFPTLTKIKTHTFIITNKANYGMVQNVIPTGRLIMAVFNSYCDYSECVVRNNVVL